MEELIATIEVQAEIIAKLRGQLREVGAELSASRDEVETLKGALRTATERRGD